MIRQNTRIVQTPALTRTSTSRANILEGQFHKHGIMITISPLEVANGMERADIIDNDRRKRGKRKDPPPKAVGSNVDRFRKKRKQAVHWKVEGAIDIQFSHRVGEENSNRKK
ncbi:hypothetical protein Tco_0757255 [Tanacetum coccineum]